MRIDIPKLNPIVQTNKGKIKDTIWSTFNIDLNTEEGKISISPRLEYTTDIFDLTGINSTMYDFTYFDNRYIGICEDHILATTGSEMNDDWEIVSSTQTITADSAVDIFNGVWVVVNQNNIVTNTTIDSSFTTRGTVANTPHTTCVFEDRFYYTDENTKIKSMNTSYAISETGSYTLDIAGALYDNPIITKIISDTNGIWFMGIFEDKRGGFIGYWDGVTENVPDFNKPTSEGLLSACLKDGEVYMFNARGKVLVYENGKFVEKGRLPIKNEILHRIANDKSARMIHPNGMMVAEDEIYMLINAKTSDSVFDEVAPIENMPSGIWSLHPEYGMYHKYSPSLNSYNGPITDFGTDGVAEVGALYPQQGFRFLTPTTQKEFLAGITAMSNVSNKKSYIYYLNSQNDRKKSGYIITNQIQAENIEESFREVVVVCNELQNTSDSVKVYYRDTDVDGVFIKINWLNTSDFTTLSDTTGVATGDMVQVLQGDGAGFHGFVTDFVSGTTSTIRTDLDCGVANNTGYVRLQKWKLIGSIEGIGEFLVKASVGVSKPKIQVKIIGTGTGKNPTIERIIIDSTINM